MSPSEIADLIAPHRPEWAATYRSIVDDDRDMNEIDSRIDDVDFFIIALASHVKGTSREVIIKKYGEMFGLGRLEFLLDEGYLKEEAGRIYASKRHTTQGCPRTTLRRVEAMAKHYDTSNLDDGAAFFSHQEYLSKTQYDMTFELMKETVQKLKKIRHTLVDEPKDRLTSLSILINFDDRED